MFLTLVPASSREIKICHCRRCLGIERGCECRSGDRCDHKTGYSRRQLRGNKVGEYPVALDRAIARESSHFLGRMKIIKNIKHRADQQKESELNEDNDTAHKQRDPGAAC